MDDLYTFLLVFAAVALTSIVLIKLRPNTEINLDDIIETSFDVNKKLAELDDEMAKEEELPRLRKNPKKKKLSVDFVKI